MQFIQLFIQGRDNMENIGNLDISVLTSSFYGVNFNVLLSHISVLLSYDIWSNSIFFQIEIPT